METIFLERTREIKKERKFLEKNLNVKINVDGRKIIIEGSPLDEYEASIILNAISFGFSAKTAITLKENEILFREIPIKDFTRKSNLGPVRARLIGKYGKAKLTIENISNCRIMIKDNSVGVIGSAEGIEYAITAVKNLIKGSKHANVYRYLERINKNKK